MPFLKLTITSRIECPTMLTALHNVIGLRGRQELRRRRIHVAIGHHRQADTKRRVHRLTCDVIGRRAWIYARILGRDIRQQQTVRRWQNTHVGRRQPPVVVIILDQCSRVADRRRTEDGHHVANGHLMALLRLVRKRLHFGQRQSGRHRGQCCGAEWGHALEENRISVSIRTGPICLAGAIAGYPYRDGVTTIFNNSTP